MLQMIEVLLPQIAANPNGQNLCRIPAKKKKYSFENCHDQKKGYKCLHILFEMKLTLNLVHHSLKRITPRLLDHKTLGVIFGDMPCLLSIDLFPFFLDIFLRDIIALLTLIIFGGKKSKEISSSIRNNPYGEHLHLTSNS